MAFIDLVRQNESNEYVQVLNKLKTQMKKAGAKLEYEDSEELSFTFKDNKKALQAFKKNSEELNFLGQSSVADGEIGLEFDTDAKRELK